MASRNKDAVGIIQDTILIDEDIGFDVSLVHHHGKFFEMTLEKGSNIRRPHC